MFDGYYKKLKDLEQDVPEIFKKVAKKGAIKFVNEAKKRTDTELLFDTGNYKRNWNAEVIEPLPETYGVQCENNVEYASFLENGYTIKKDYFVPFDKMESGVKTKLFIQQFKAKYPNAKGFIRKAGRYKGKFVGKLALEDARFYCLEQLEDALDKAYKQK